MNDTVSLYVLSCNLIHTTAAVEQQQKRTSRSIVNMHEWHLYKMQDETTIKPAILHYTPSI